jgi:hypothetical protein
MQWLTIPVRVKGRYEQKIRETEVEGADWTTKHWMSLKSNYARASCFRPIADWLEQLYSEATGFTHLSQINRHFIEAVCIRLGIATKISSSCDYEMIDGKTERLADLCRQAGGTDYVSGPAARDYIEPEVFRAHGIGLHWFDYSGYPTYPQVWGPFEHGVTILDLLFNCGAEAPRYMKHVRQ